MLFSSGSSPLRGIAYARNSRSKRLSSYDRSGANGDSSSIPVGETLTLAEITGAGCINHIWFTIDCEDLYYLRKLILRMYWDGEDNPSVETPVGDFFGVGHARVSMYTSLAFSMVTAPRIPFNAGMNCFLPMPFANGARITITNEAEMDVGCMYFYIDYEELDALSDDALRFHALWNREKNTGGPGTQYEATLVHNLDGDGNYVLFEAEGRGHYIGCNISVDNLEGGWFGEGDDMIFIDGEKWPPSLHGTGTEDYFCAAWGFPSGQYSGPFHGISLAGDPETASGKWSVYRHHLEDPVVFHKSIKVTIEHGHANMRDDDWSSVGYWYQTEPHKPFPAMLPVEERMPRMTEDEAVFYAKSLDCSRLWREERDNPSITREERTRLRRLWDTAIIAGGNGDYQTAIHNWDEIINALRGCK